jgi:geranylgeranyl diphosphate synthase, type II
MNMIAHYQDVVERKLGQMALNPKPNGLYDPIRYILGLGGKRIRPAVCMAMCHFFGGSDNDSLGAALGLEVFHNFTLLHDDIMDNAPIRRNQPTVHEKWNRNTAILSGDAMMIVASKLMLDVPSHVIRQVQDIYLKTALEVCEGQQFDMDFESSTGISTTHYLEMIRLKTAVLLAASMKIGAVIGGADDNNADLCYQFGQDLGLAFQLQDDYLDVFGKEEEFGKSIGNDIVCNKKTFLLLGCLERCNTKQLSQLEYWLQLKDFNNDEKIASVKQLFVELGIGQIAKLEMDKYFARALTHLEKMSIAQDAKDELAKFAAKLINRNR